MPRPTTRLCSLAALLLAAACREGSENQAADFLPIAASTAGTQGCALGLTTPATATPLFLSPLIGPESQLAAAADSETVYWTASDGSIHALDLSVFPPVDSVLVAAGVIEASVLAPAGIGAQATPSGIAVFDAQFLIVAEHTSNSLVSVRRDLPDTVEPLAGLISVSGGYADGAGGGIRFNFVAPSPLMVDSSGFVYVGDSGNHALRRIELGAIPESSTLTGSGAPGDSSGPLTVTQLDTPSGLAAACSGELYLVEAGTAGFGGHRLLSLGIGAEDDFFGGFAGSALALAGDGTAETTQGTDTAAHLASPKGLVVTADGLAYWVDANAGILRRYDLATGLSDCPLFADCASAVTASGSFTGTNFSLALGASGTLYVLECDAGTLHAVEP
jgi:hypothetical protein